MKNKLLVILLLIVALNHNSSAQEKKDRLTHIVIGQKVRPGGATSLQEFEINYQKKELFQILNFAEQLWDDKSRMQKKKASKKEWKKLNKLADDLIVECGETPHNDKKYIYFISFYTSSNDKTDFSYTDHNVPEKLMEILNYVQKIK